MTSLAQWSTSALKTQLVEAFGLLMKQNGWLEWTMLQLVGKNMLLSKVFVELVWPNVQLEQGRVVMN